MGDIAKKVLDYFKTSNNAFRLLFWENHIYAVSQQS